MITFPLAESYVADWYLVSADSKVVRSPTPGPVVLVWLTTLTVPSVFTITLEPLASVPDAVSSVELPAAGKLVNWEPSPLNEVAVITPTFKPEVWMLSAFIKPLLARFKLSPTASSCSCCADESTISGNLSAMVL